MPIKIKIDVTKINKEALFHGKNGAKYCDIVVWPNDAPDQYGNDYAVQQELPKEMRDAGSKNPYIGNGKNFGQQSRQPAPQQRQQPQSRPGSAPPVDDDTDIPFASLPSWIP